MVTVTEQLAECRRGRKLAEDDRDKYRLEVTVLKSSRTQLYLSFATAVFFMLVLVTLAVFIAQPTLWQYTLFRTILSLAAAGIAALLPGDFEFRFKNLVRATGALGVFAFVFSQNPAQLAGIPEPRPTESFQFKILSMQTTGPFLSCFTLPYSDVLKLGTKEKILNTISDYMKRYQNIPFSTTDYTIYRKIDEKVVERDGDTVDSGNDGLILVDMHILPSLQLHVAFTMANTTPCR